MAEHQQPQADSWAGLRRYLQDCLEAGTVNEQIVARTALKLLAAATQPEPKQEPALLTQVLDALRIGKVACEWAGENAMAQQVAEAYDAARLLASTHPAASKEQLQRWHDYMGWLMMKAGVERSEVIGELYHAYAATPAPQPEPKRADGWTSDGDGWLTSPDGLTRKRAAPDAAAPMVPSHSRTILFGRAAAPQPAPSGWKPGELSEQALYASDMAAARMTEDEIHQRDWWCPHCLKDVPPEMVTKDGEHYLESGGCGRLLRGELKDVSGEMLAASPHATDSGGGEVDDGGPLREGWQIMVGPGHSGFGVYAVMEEYQDEGSVCLAVIAEDDTPAAWMRKDGMKAMPADEKEAWNEAGQAEIAADYTIPLYTHPASGEMRNCCEKGEADRG